MPHRDRFNQQLAVIWSEMLKIEIEPSTVHAMVLAEHALRSHHQVGAVPMSLQPPPPDPLH